MPTVVAGQEQGSSPVPEASPEEARWEREALRLCDRYVREVVLAFDLCPWAEPAVRAGRVARAVCLVATPAPADCFPFIDRLMTGGPVSALERAPDVVSPPLSPPPADIGLLLFPKYTGSWAAFDAFAERVRRADRDRVPSGTMPQFLIAAFHPGGAETFTGPNQLVSFLRRSPDPLLQFVRADAIQRLKTTRPEVSAEIARHNHDALAGPLNAERLQAFARAIDAIRTDRDASYADLTSHPNAS